MKAIILDCDGVLIDSEYLASRSEVEMKAKHGIHVTLEEQIAKFTGRAKSDPVMIEELARLPADYSGRLDTYMIDVYKRDLKPIAGTVEFLSRLKLPRACCSNSEPEELEFKLELVGLKKFFGENIFSRASVKNPKPAPDLYLYALKCMGIAAADALVVEDSVLGVMAAKAAKVKVCGFLGGKHVLPGHAENLKQAGADLLLSDLRDLLNEDGSPRA